LIRFFTKISSILLIFFSLNEFASFCILRYTCHTCEVFDPMISLH